VSNPPGKTLTERIDVTEVEQAAGIVRSRPRVKGSKREQRSIRRVRTAFATLLENNAASYQAMFEKAADKDPMKALALMVSLAEYYMPKLGRIEQTGTVESCADRIVIEGGDDMEQHEFSDAAWCDVLLDEMRRRLAAVDLTAT
jgi:hypothetical protein